ncbi:MAG: DUF4339 domain-containing protein [bacterium]|nr:DUF4339 domain-containing protein [bacterium]
MTNFYIHKDEQQLGPFSIEELKDLKISKYTMVWFEGAEGWQKASEINELNDIIIATPPPMQKVVVPPPMPNASILEAVPVSTKKGLNKKILIVLGVAIIVIIIVVGFYYKVKNDALIETQKAIEVERIITQKRIEEERIAEEKKIADITLSSKIAKQEALEARKKYVRNHIENYFDRKASYNVNPFGGITNVLVNFYNNSEFPIDEAIVRISYIKDNGAVWTTVDVALTNIAAKGFATERATDSNRGARINGEIISIKSKALELCYSGVSPGVDPYKCK